MFNAKIEADKIINFIKDYFKKHPFLKGVVIGISGGKDSTVVASLCAKALGKDKVFGVLMPNGVQSDIADSIAVCDFLGIEHAVVNIKEQYDTAIKSVEFELTADAKLNIAPRIRMLNLYLIAQTKGMLVTCNSNLSERTIGYSTKWGDNVGDIAPIMHLTKSEVVEVGKALNIPQNLIEKPPADGLSGQTDEDRFGFTYEALDGYIKTGKGDAKTIEKINKWVNANKHKAEPIPTVKNVLERSASEEELVNKLIAKGYTIASAESCTGGLFSATVINVPNASRVINGSMVTYSSEIKNQFVSVSEDSLKKHGVVSETVAGEMAKGVAKQFGAQVGVGITGIAGPDGGSLDTPVGTVCFGFYINGKLYTYKMLFSNMNRMNVRLSSVEFALKKVLELLG